ncbi:hypothetical protein [Bacillus sp. AFS017336]|uniref:hypothetical protein n=1 Tax=Bacillus sp. AFS017336 TaxID=2033489 RepID=UPI000BF14D15|nr:hypothetical protein [Bacillus sp. AFS017336]PEL13775.1 hypothetical protein CN601_03420 [Bacillus sp. AFS017336]
MLIKNFTSDDFVRAYNPFSSAKSKFHLTEDEFYIYSFLFTYRGHDNSIRTCIYTINDLLPVKFVKGDSKNMGKIKEVILSLIDKKVFISHRNNEDLKNHSTLEFTINDMEIMNDGVSENKQVDEDNKFMNYSMIPYTKLLEFSSARDLYIYYVVSKWETGCKLSYSSWGNILGVNTRSAIRIIDDAVERGVIYKNIGNYSDSTVDGRNQKQQDSNVYKITPFNQKQKTIQTKKNEILIEPIQVDEVKVSKVKSGSGFGKRPQRNHKSEEKDIADMLAAGIDSNKPIESDPDEEYFGGHNPNFRDILNAESPYEFMDEEITIVKSNLIVIQNGKAVPFGKFEHEKQPIPQKKMVHDKTIEEVANIIF